MNSLSMEQQVKNILHKRKNIILKVVDGERLSNQITQASQEYARSGFSPSTCQRMTNLAYPTIDSRLYLQKYNRTHAQYSAGYSNATFSGDLIDSYQNYWTKWPAKFSVGYYIPDTIHQGYKTPEGRVSQNKMTNIRRKLKRLGKDPAGFKIVRSHPFYRKLKGFIRYQISKGLS